MANYDSVSTDTSLDTSDAVISQKIEKKTILQGLGLVQAAATDHWLENKKITVYYIYS